MKSPLNDPSKVHLGTPNAGHVAMSPPIGGASASIRAAPAAPHLLGDDPTGDNDMAGENTRTGTRSRRGKSYYVYIYIYLCVYHVYTVNIYICIYIYVYIYPIIFQQQHF